MSGFGYKFAWRIAPSVAMGLLLLQALPVWADEVGTVAAVDGTAEVGRDNTWTPAVSGVPIMLGDTLRTGTPGRLRVVFRDDSVLALADDSRITVDEQVFNPADGNARSLFGLVRGKIAAAVSDAYRRQGARFEIGTATAVAGVRGTEFSMHYDPDGNVTEVLGIVGVVSVHSTADPTGPGILVTAQETTTVAADRMPSAPRRIDDSLFQKRLREIEFLGVSGNGELSRGHPLLAGLDVPQQERAPVVIAAPGSGAGVGGFDSLGGPNAGNLIGQSPAAVKSSTGSLPIDVGTPR